MPKITANAFILPVKDLDVAAKFYIDAFDLREVFRAERIVFLGIPGTDTAVGLLLEPEAAGSGPQNVGFHLDHDIDREEVLSAIEASGGDVVERAEHAPGVPYARITDPDGNVLEI